MSQTPKKESFADLLEQDLASKKNFEGNVVKGTIVGIQNDSVTIDIGLKSEGRVNIREFMTLGQMPEIKIGDTIDVYVERMEDRNGEAAVSIEKAKREAVWVELEDASSKGTLVNGVIFGKVKGGFAVDLNGAVAFLPGSQVDIRPVRDVGPLMNIVQPFKILKMDKPRSNIVVSRRSVLEESRAEARTELVANLNEGQILEGIVKNITDYGAFIDLGGVDGLLHVTDISWRRINHPSDVLKMGETIKVQVIRFNKETQRISLGMKQLESDPWVHVEERFKVGDRYHGKVTSIADYGAFVELEPAIEGLIYHTEISWTKKNMHPGKVLTVGQEVDIMVLDIDSSKRRISLGLKQCQDNPWQRFMKEYPVGSLVEGEIKNITEFGLFVGVFDDLDGMVHINDVTWEKDSEQALANYKKGDKVKVKVLDIDPEKERISLGIKQLGDDPFAGAFSGLKKGDVITATVSAVSDKGVDVTLTNGLTGHIKKIDLSRDREFQKPERFATGEKVDAKITAIDEKKRTVALSIKALEIEEQEKVMAQYGSESSGASLGDILGAAMSEAKAKAAPKKKAAKEEETAE